MPAVDTVIDRGHLLLRRFTTDDLEALHQLGSRPEIIRYAQAVPLAPREQALDATEAGEASIEFARSLSTPCSAAGAP